MGGEVARGAFRAGVILRREMFVDEIVSSCCTRLLMGGACLCDDVEIGGDLFLPLRVAKERVLRKSLRRGGLETKMSAKGVICEWTVVA